MKKFYILAIGSGIFIGALALFRVNYTTKAQLGGKDKEKFRTPIVATGERVC